MDRYSTYTASDTKKLVVQIFRLKNIKILLHFYELTRKWWVSPTLYFERSLELHREKACVGGADKRLLTSNNTVITPCYSGFCVGNIGCL